MNQAVAHQRGNTNDSYNHETFGSSEYTSDNRVEEEKKRRGNHLFMMLDLRTGTSTDVVQITFPNYN